jgi:hypothetical protein
MYFFVAETFTEYKGFQEEILIFFEMIKSVVVKKARMNIFLIFISYWESELLESLDLDPLHYFLWGWKKNNIYKTKVGKRAELLFRNFHAAARIKKHEDQLRQTTRELRTRVVKWIEVSGGIFHIIYCAP